MSTVERINAKIDNLQFNYFGIMSVSLLTGTCLASVALIFIVMNESAFWQIALLSCVAMASNAAAIASSPLRWVVWLFGINVLVSLFLIVVNLF